MLFFDLLKSKKDKEKILDKFLDIRVLPAPTYSDGYSTERWIETSHRLFCSRLVHLFRWLFHRKVD